MERRNSKEWINSLKIAIINNDLQKLEEYSHREIPNFFSIDEAKEALNLIHQATKILLDKKTDLAIKMNAIKQSQKFNISTHSSTFNFKA